MTVHIFSRFSIIKVYFCVDDENWSMSKTTFNSICNGSKVYVTRVTVKRYYTYCYSSNISSTTYFFTEGYLYSSIY